MFKTKKDVDRHVRWALSKLHSENEKNLRGFTIAKLYFKIHEYPTAQHYVSSYLGVNEESAPAHKLLGQCLLQLKKPDKALESFQRSLNLDPKQPDLLIEVCKMLLDDGSTLSNNKAKYWCDLAESENVQHNAVFSLRLKLLNKSNLETTQIEELIFKEIAARPTDPNLRVRIVKHFIEQNKIIEAFRYAYDLEMNNHSLFYDCIDWYNIVWLAVSKYRQIVQTQTSWDYWLLSMICIERQVELSFKNVGGVAKSALSNANTTDIANLLFTFDQHLFEAAKNVLELVTEKELGTQFLYHFGGQLCLHAAALIFRREQVQNKNQWREATKSVLPLLLFAFHYGIPDTKESWLKHISERTRQVVLTWQREGAFRCAQAGRTLLSCFDNSRTSTLHGQVHSVISDQNIWSSADEVLTQVRQYCSDQSWRTKLFRILFPNSDQLVKMKSSHLVIWEAPTEPVYEMPKRSDVESYEEIAQYLRPQSLEHMSYLSLGVERLNEIQCKYFNGLNFAMQNLAFCGAESLTRLDIDTFLYATVIQAKRNYEVERTQYENYNAKNVGKPRILPFANMSTNLCSEAQANWWQAAYSVYRNLGGDNLAELRATLQYGIEAVRGINGPKMDLIIILKLGKILAMRAQSVTKSTERAFLDGRVLALYKYGLTMLKLHTKGVLKPFRKLFKYSNANSSAVEQEINELAEEAVTLVASRYFKSADYEECIEELAGIQLPYATYFQAEAYRKLDESNKTPRKTKKLYSDKAKDCLEQTVQLLSFAGDNNHPLKSVVQSEIKKMQYNDVALNSRDDDELLETRREILNESFSPYRSQREPTLSAAKTVELENLIKQIMNTLSFVKDELVDRIRPEVSEIKQDISVLKEKVSMLEETAKKRSEPPSREDAGMLDDLYIIGEDLQPVTLNQFTQQQQIQQQQRMHPSNAALLNQPTMLHTPHNPQIPSANLYSSPMYNPMTGTLTNSLLNQQSHHAQYNANPAAANSYNTAHYNPNYPFNYYSQMMLPQMNLGLPPTPQQQLMTQNDTAALYDMLNIPAAPTVSSIPEKPLPKPDAQAANSVPAMWKRLYNNAPVEKGPPVNVVITSSDPLPTHTTISTQSTLSVTIPPQHIKPSLVPNELSTAVQPSTSFPMSFGSTTSTTSTASAAPVTSSIFAPVKLIDGKSAALNASNESASTEHNKSTDSEYDPRPDFKPIIPLPAEVEVTTGEENEEILFCARAKLLRLIEKEWKERGLGDIKILKHKTDGKIRILMRREQTHKMCANHYITPEIKLTPAKNDEKSLIWCADDYADEIVKREKLCVRFKQVETAKEFKSVFHKAQEILKTKESVDTPSKEPEKPAPSGPFGLSKASTFNFMKTTTSTPIVDSKTVAATTKADDKPATTSNIFGASKLGFGLTPAEPVKETKSTDPTKPSPFANFSFSASTVASKPADSLFANIFSKPTAATSSPATAPLIASSPIVNDNNTTKDTIANKSTVSEGDDDDYVPTAQFQPVIPLPDLVEVETGEENEDILFEHRAKLLRFDKTTGEWKERGIGQMRVLVDRNDPNRVRLVMRREQVLKLCCNQRLLKDIEFKFALNSTNALTWVGKDFSDGVLQTEVLAVRFKTAEICKQFHNVILKAQEEMSDEQYDSMEGETTNSQDSIQGATKSPAIMAQLKSNNVASTASGKTESKEATIGFGDKFKPKAGSWNCTACYISNTADTLYCVACETPKDATVPKKSPFEGSGNALTVPATSKPAFSFGFAPAGAAPTAAITTAASAPKPAESAKSVQGFGDKFKPKSGSWSCQACYISNDGSNFYCVACDSPKDETVPKKEANKPLVPSSTTSKFQFGFSPTAPAAATVPATVDPTKSIIETPTATIKPADSIPNAFDFGSKGGFVFGTQTPNPFAPTTNANGTTTVAPAPFNFSSAASMFSVSNETKTKPATKPPFDLSLKPAVAGTANGGDDGNYNLEKSQFNFTLKPKSPGKAKSPLKNTSGVEDESDEENIEEENNTYFTPVIPLPDKVDVVTGEENEDELYCHRSKLYRFTGGEWKERGIGDVKILRHRQTKKLRVVMRREKVHKICLNHALTADIEYKPKDEKSWHFVAGDYSEGELQSTVFSIRFKNKEIANGFIQAIKNALNDTPSDQLADDKTTNAVTENVAANDLSDDVRKLADSLRLPYSFYEHDEKECSGCRGCDPESFVFSDYESVVDNEADTSAANPIPLTMPQLCIQNKAILKQSLLATPTLTSSSTKTNATAAVVAAETTKSDDVADKFVFSLGNSKLEDSSQTKPAFESGGFLFGNSKQSFGSDKAKPIFGQSIFGNASAAEKPTAASIFGGNTNTTTTSIFGTVNNTTVTGNVFDGKTENSATAQDAATAATEKNLFSSLSMKQTENQPMFGTKTNFAFGSSTFGTNTTSAFGSSSTTAFNIFGGSVFGGAQMKENGDTVATSSTESGNKENEVAIKENEAVPKENSAGFGSNEPMFKNDPGLDFASLAANATNQSGNFQTSMDIKPPPGGFVGLTQSNNFSRFLMSGDAKNNSSLNASNTSQDGNTDDTNYDPHYEPIIDLPELINVSTGEEHEEKLFGERGVLYRYDTTNKEWKERGTGEIKILFHPERGTSRLLMRREQIHKLVLNHAITEDFTMKPMNPIGKAFCWYAMNYAEGNDAEVESLAVRFKNVDLARKFETEILQCVEKAKQHGADLEED